MAVLSFPSALSVQSAVELAVFRVGGPIMMLQCRKMGDGTMSILYQHVVDKLQVALSIMVRYGICVFAAVLRREAAERVAKPGPFQDTAPVGLRRRECTALARTHSLFQANGMNSLFQANGMNSVLRSRHPRHAMFGPRLKNHGFGPQAAFGAVKTGRLLQKESPRPSRFGPARCGPGILIFCSEVMYSFPFLGRKMEKPKSTSQRGLGDWSGRNPLPRNL